MSATFNLTSLTEVLQRAVADQLESTIKKKLLESVDSIVAQAAKEVTESVMVQVASVEMLADHTVHFNFKQEVRSPM